MALTTITGNMVSVNAIQGTLIADNAITAVHIASNAVTSIQIAENNVTAREIASNSITVAQLADASVESDKIANGVITTNHLNSAMISSQTEVTAVAGDFVLLGDTSDSNNLKKAPVSSLAPNALPLAGGTMTGTIAGFTSTGIDDNATSTAITIDSSENVGIAGQTSPTYKFDGGFADQTWGWYLSSAYNSGFTYNTTERSLLIHTKSGDNLDHIKFAVGTSATERLRIASAGQIGIGGANYGTDGQILTSTGATSAPAWEDAPASGPSKGLAIVLSMIF
jgi:hypothetical protein